MRAVTESLKVTFDRGWGFLNQIIEVAPENVWVKTGGGYPFWQQVYHCFACVDFFIAPAGDNMDDAVAMFKTTPAEAMSKGEVKAFGEKMKAKADAWIAGLDDAALAATNEGLSARRGMPMTNAVAFSAMIGHSSYHVGGCDAVLRDNGEKGVM